MKTKPKDDPLKYARTFKEWHDQGFRILKGEHAIGKNEKGEPLFGEDQVWFPAPKKKVAIRGGVIRDGLVTQWDATVIACPRGEYAQEAIERDLADLEREEEGEYE